MGRRNSAGEVGFGSDSFLDIIANIVGILIILIVVAGVKVARAPVPTLDVNSVQSDGRNATSDSTRRPDDALDLKVVLAESTQSEAAVSDKTDQSKTTTDSNPELDASVGASDSSPEPMVPYEIVLPKLIPRAGPIVVDPSEELVAQTSLLEQRLKETEQTVMNLRSSLSGVARELDEARNQTEEQAQQLKSFRDQLDTAIRDESALKSALNANRARIEQLEKELEDAEESSRRVVRIPHKLTSIARTVERQEAHFRLAANHVSFVPIDELLARLKGQIERQKDWLIKFNQHEGVVGPVNGYSMNYLVERHSLSAIDQLRYGSGLVRIGVSRWQIERDATIEAESEDEALQPSSLFRRKLMTLKPGTVVTLWTYPDSFELYQALRQVAHQEGFEVAGRPIPTGMPIAGGPRGSRSQAQ